MYDLPKDGKPLEGALGEGRRVKFDEPSYEMGMGAAGDFSASVIQLSYTSLSTPSSSIDIDLDTMIQVVKKVTPVRGSFSRDKYETMRLWATSADGVKVPQ